MKIKVKLHDLSCKIEIYKKGEWIDLKAAETVKLEAPSIDTIQKTVSFNSALIPLGLSMELPKYFEANIVPRSSTFNNFKIILSNSFGIIDSTYKGDKDEWKFNVIALANTKINKGDRIAQFRIRPSQFAPWFVKLKWLFTSKISFVFVDTLSNKSRGGFGTTGTK